MKKNIGFILITTLLILATALSISGTVMSQSRTDVKIDREYYEQLEREYVREIRSYLAEQGYENSGVMLNYISGGGSARKYTVTIHNEKIDTLSDAEKAVLKSEILSLAFDVPECTFFQEFLSI